jgi:hypothetical protein
MLQPLSGSCHQRAAARQVKCGRTNVHGNRVKRFMTNSEVLILLSSSELGVGAGDGFRRIAGSSPGRIWQKADMRPADYGFPA